MTLAEDQHAIEDLPAQGTDKAPADRIHPQRLDRGAQDPGVGAWKTASKDAVKFDSRSRIKDLRSSNRSPRLRATLRGSR